MGREGLTGTIIDECRRHHGQGQFFPRTDGLEREARRAAVREQYLNAHPETPFERRQAILRAEVTPGMTRDEAVAAWGLIEEDWTLVAGRRTADEQHTYAALLGFVVGEIYTLYLIDNIVAGVQAEPPPSVVPAEAGVDRELDKRIAYLFLGVSDFYIDDEGYLRGASPDLDNQDKTDRDTRRFSLHDHVYVPFYATDRRAALTAEVEVRRRGRFDEYVAALSALGADHSSAGPVVRCRAILQVFAEAEAVELPTHLSARRAE